MAKKNQLFFHMPDNRFNLRFLPKFNICVLLEVYTYFVAVDKYIFNKEQDYRSHK